MCSLVPPALGFWIRCKPVAFNFPFCKHVTRDAQTLGTNKGVVAFSQWDSLHIVTQVHARLADDIDLCTCVKLICSIGTLEIIGIYWM